MSCVQAVVATSYGIWRFGNISMPDGLSSNTPFSAS
jgi:hypothetical protein